MTMFGKKAWGQVQGEERAGKEKHGMLLVYGSFSPSFHKCLLSTYNVGQEMLWALQTCCQQDSSVLILELFLLGKIGNLRNQFILNSIK